MQKISIFVGPPLSGKTSTAKALAEGKKTSFLDGFRKNPVDYPWLIENIEKDTELIIVDDIYTGNNLKTWIDAAISNDLFKDKQVILVGYSSIVKVDLEKYFNHIEIRYFTMKKEKQYYFKITRENKPGNSLEAQMLEEIKTDDRQIISEKEKNALKDAMPVWIESLEAKNKRCKPGMIKAEWTSCSDKKDEFCYVGGLCTISFYLIEEKDVGDA